MKSSVAAVVLCILLVGLAGCATKTIPSTQDLQPTESEGILMFSVSQWGYRKIVATVSFRDVDGGNVQFVSTPGGMGSFYSSDSDRDDFNSGGSRGQVYAINLTPGDYEVHRWSVDTGHAVFTPADELSLPFTIASGKSTYIGDFFFNIARGQNLFGLPLPYLDDVEHRNSWERDLAALQRKYPTVDLGDIDFSVLETIRELEGDDGLEQRVNTPLYVPPVTH